jgi:hypothetical protein
MSDAFILPLWAAIGGDEADADEKARVQRPEPPRAAVERVATVERVAPQRPRAQRLPMLSAGYRAAVDGTHVALVNLSLTGAQVRGLVGLRPDQPAVVKIGWPQDEQSCAAFARVRWVELENDPSSDQRIYRVGLAFETWDVRRLKDIMRHCERTFGRTAGISRP